MQGPQNLTSFLAYTVDSEFIVIFPLLTLNLCKTFSQMYQELLEKLLAKQLIPNLVLVHKLGKIEHFKRQLCKIVKHTQRISWQKPTNGLGVFDHFVGLAFKGLTGDFY